MNTKAPFISESSVLHKTSERYNSSFEFGSKGEPLLLPSLTVTLMVPFIIIYSKATVGFKLASVTETGASGLLVM